MSKLKLAKLPDRTPVKLTVTISPELNSALLQYAGYYEKSYGQKENVVELVPYMLQAFLGSDKGFRKVVKLEGSD